MFFGKVTEFRSRLQMANPEIDLLDADTCVRFRREMYLASFGTEEGLEDEMGPDDELYLAPTAEDLDDILGYVERVTSGGGAPDALDTELDALLDAERGPTDE